MSSKNRLKGTNKLPMCRTLSAFCIGKAMSGFGENFKKMLEERNLSVSDLARLIETPVKSVQEWVSKDRVPRDFETIKKLSEVFKCSVHQLMFGTEDPYNLLKTEVHTGMYEITIKKVNPK
jgi:transcriptional regulator with XRE-family HTH domain